MARTKIEPLLRLKLPGKGPTRTDLVLEGRVAIETTRGLAPLSRLLIESAIQVPAPPGFLSIGTSDPLALLSLAALHPGAPAHYYHLDLFHTALAREVAATAQLPLTAHCLPDLPELNLAPGMAFMQCTKTGEAGLVLEWLRQAHARLAMGGKLLVTINNTHDKWLRGQLERIFGNATLAAREKHGLLYLSKKTAAAPAAPAEHFHKHISVKFGPEAPDAALDFETAYGVFSSDDLDEGSRALLETLTTPTPCESILDLGCGWGALGILVARRTGARRVTMIDANARAVELARNNTARHGVPAEVRHEARAESLAGGREAGAYDLVISNPPYGTEFRVAELFLQAALATLRPGGQVWVVAKHNPILIERMQDLFGNAQVHHRRGYEVIQSIRKLAG